MTLEEFWHLQADWSRATFGADTERGPIGPMKHLAKEIDKEILPALADWGFDKPVDASLIEEYCDGVFLLFDSARRAKISLEEIVSGCYAKLAKNQMREWQKPTGSDEPVEHVRTKEEWKGE